MSTLQEGMEQLHLPPHSASSSSVQSSLDPDDIFAAVLSFPQATVEAGKHAGQQEGMIAGYQEGEEMGLRHGTALGHELGFYAAVVETFTDLNKQQPSLYPINQRSLSLLDRLSLLLSSANLQRPQEDQFRDQLNLVRVKFKQLLQQLNLSTIMKQQQEHHLNTGSNNENTTSSANSSSSASSLQSIAKQVEQSF